MLEIKNLSVTFPNIKAVRNLSFLLKKGEILGIIGESGSGKTTAILSLLRLLSPSTSIQGEILFEGKDLLLEKEIRQVRGKKIGIVFQDPSLNPSLCIGKQILEAALPHRKISKEEIYALMRQVGLSDPEIHFSQYPHQLSGGAAQRIAIACALAARPQILIADEPTTALDASIQMQIVSLLKELQAKEKMSMIVISHNLHVIARLSSRVLVMYAGKIVEEGLVEDILENPQHPYTKALLEATPRFALLRSQKLQAIKGSPPSPSSLPKGCAFRERCPHATEKCGEEPPLYRLTPTHTSACWLHEKEKRS